MAEHQCMYCGRKGSRQFVSLYGSGRDWICSRKLSCDRRRRSWNRRFRVRAK